MRTPELDEKTAVAGLLVIGFILRLYNGLNFWGYLHPDSLLSVLEPAHKLAYGMGYTPWEFLTCYRPTLQVYLAAAVMKILGDIGAAIITLKVLFAIASTLLAYICFRIAKGLFGKEAGIYTLFFAVFSVDLIFWTRDLNSHIPSLLFLMAAVYALTRSDDRMDGILAGLLLGVGFMFRFDTAMYAPLMVGYLLIRRHWSNAVFFGGGFAVIVIIQGLLDLFTQGGFLCGPINALSFNVSSGNSAVMGSYGAYFYLWLVVPNVIVLALGLLSFEKKHKTLFILVLATFNIAFYSTLPIKQVRYMLPAIAIFCILAGKGMERVRDRFGRAAVIIAVGLAVLLYLLVVPHTKFEMTEEFFMMTRWVGEKEDVKGVAYDYFWAYSGGYANLHKRVPFVNIVEVKDGDSHNLRICGRINANLLDYQCSSARTVFEDGEINYFILAGEHELDGRFEIVKQSEHLTVYHRRD